MKWEKEGEKAKRVYRLISDAGEYTGISIKPHYICSHDYSIYMKVAKNTEFALEINRHLQLEKAQFFAEKIFNHIKEID